MFSFKKFVLALTLPFAFLAGCHEKKESAASVTDKLIVGTAPDYKPFSYMENGKITGFEIDLIEEIGKRLGLTVDVNQLGFDAIIAALKVGKIHMAIASIAKTEERAKEIDFTEPYYMSPTAALLRVEDPEEGLDESTKNDILVLNGTAQEQELRKKFLNNLVTLGKIKPLPNTNELIQTFAKSKNAIIVVDSVIAKEITDNNPHIKLKLVVLEDIGRFDFSIAVAKGATLKGGKKLVEGINEVLNQMKEDGTLKRIKEKYGLSE